MSWLSHKNKPDEAGDESLVKSYRDSGDLAVLCLLYEKYMPMVYGVCLKYLSNEQQSEDAVMQIFEELIVKVTLHEVKNFRSWLYILSRNYCLMQLRSARKMETLSIDEVMELPLILNPDGEQDEQRLQELEKCLHKLTRAQQQSIDLFYIKEKCYMEVAELTGYTLNEVKSYIQNGKRNLKICLENNREH